MRRLHALAAFLLAFVVMPAAAQSAYSGCLERSDNASCKAGRERHQLGIYGVRPIDQLARDGVAAHRIFVLDARQNDIGLIAFVRDHNAAPRLILQPPGYGLRRPAPLSIEIPMDAWAEKRRDADGFHRRPGGDRRTFAAADEVCPNNWTFIIESGTPGDGTTLPRSTVEVVDQCTYGAYSDRLVERALRRFPACAHLADAAAAPYEPAMLCARLRAEPASVDTWLALAPLFGPGNRNPAVVRAAFAPEAVLDWDEITQTSGNAADRWLREMQARSAVLDFERIEALDGGRARFTGYVVFSQEGGHNWRARAVLELARDGSGRLRIVRARLGRYLRA